MRTAGRAGELAWIALAILAGAIAAGAAARWAWAVSLRGPVLYGEGAVAHAAVLAREGAQYASFQEPVFVAANYTPLFFSLASLGDPFVTGRVVSIGSTLAVAGAIAWSARAGGAAVAIALGAGWLALAPTALWGAAVKPDLLALALTVGAVLALGTQRPTDAEARRAGAPGRGLVAPGPHAALAGTLVALAVAAKPTALLPAFALAAWLALTWRPRALASYVTAGMLVAAALLIATPGGLRALRRHVIEHNALPWSLEQAATLALVGALVIGAVVAGAIAWGRLRGPEGAYLAGALGIVALGGREGATINYLLDASAAGALALAAFAPRLRRLPAAALAGAAQVVIGAVLLDPLALLPGRGSGAWGEPARLETARGLPAGPVLIEDAGLLVAQGREPVIDDLFLWSRLAELGVLDREPLLQAIVDGRFLRIASEVDLSRLAEAPAFERQRWPPWLASAVLERYALAERAGGLYVYAPR